MSTLGQYRATPETLNDGDQRYPRLDSTGAIVLSGGSGGGGAATIADGADVAEGAKADAAYTDVTGAASGSLVAMIKGVFVKIAAFATQNHTDLIAATPAGANIIGKVGVDQTTPGTTNAVAETGKVATSSFASYTNGTFNPVTLGQGGQVVIAIGIRSGATDGFSNNNVACFTSIDSIATIAQTAPYVFNGTTWDRQKKANLASRLLSSAATTNATSVKASAGDIFKIVGNNTVASKRYLKLYNKASAPTVGTDTPVLTICLIASAAFDFSFTAGMYFGTGIAYAITGAAADADTTAIASGDIECLNIGYA